MEAIYEILDFASFLKKHYPEYQIDDDIYPVVSRLGLWAARNPKFEKNAGDYLDKGICLMGPVGVGKTELMRMLRRYVGYLQSPYAWGYNIVWNFSEDFSTSGYACFNDQKEGNMYYDELCLLDDITKTPLKEMVSHFGNKTLVGSHLILMRYEVFKNFGYQSHFSTNCTLQQMEEAYGERAISRLSEMVNFIPVEGTDRRISSRPIFLANKNNPLPPKSREITADEVLETKKRLNFEYNLFCEDGSLSDMAAIDYILLNHYGCVVATEDELRALMASVQTEPDKVKQALAEHLVEPPENQPLRKHLTIEANNKDKKKHDLWVWETTKRLAVMMFYQKAKDAGKKVIFDLDPVKQISE